MPCIYIPEEIVHNWCKAEYGYRQQKATVNKILSPEIWKRASETPKTEKLALIDKMKYDTS